VKVGLGSGSKDDGVEDKGKSDLNQALTGQQPNPFGLALNASGGLTVGQGTFIANDYVRNELVLWSASVAPS
jgi:hypothetical protein